MIIAEAERHIRVLEMLDCRHNVHDRELLDPFRMVQRQAMCDALAQMGEPANVVEALDRAEAHMESGLATVSELKSAVSELYNVLDEDQRATLDAMMKNFRHMRG